MVIVSGTFVIEPDRREEFLAGRVDDADLILSVGRIAVAEIGIPDVAVHGDGKCFSVGVISEYLGGEFQEVARVADLAIRAR